MDKLIHRKIKGSTVLEVIVAMVLLMIVVAVCSTIWINIIYGQAVQQKLQASILGSRLLEESVQAYPEESIFTDSLWVIDKQIEESKQANIEQITIIISNRQGKKLWTGRQLVWAGKN